MLELIAIEIEGFGSIIKPIEYKLNTPGLTIIKGKNGSGKTSILSAISWVIYGKTLKQSNSVEPWPEVIAKAQGYKGTRVTLKCCIDGEEATIIRHANYTGKTLGYKGANRLVLLLGGKEVILRDKGDIKKAVLERVGMSFELFKNAILFGQNLNRLISESGSSKKEILEEAFELTYLARAKALAETRHKVVLAESNELYAKVESDEVLLKSTKEKLTIIKNAQKVFKAEKRRRLEALTKKLSDYKSRLKGNSKDIKVEIRALKAQLDELEGKRDSCQDTLTKILELAKVQRDYDNTTDVCGRCGLKIHPDLIKIQKATIKKELTKLKASIKSDSSKDKLKSKLDLIDSKIESLEDRIEKLESTLKSNSHIKREIREVSKEIKVEKARKSPEVSKDPKAIEKITSTIEQLRASIKESKAKLLKLSQKNEILTWAIKQPLSNSGIKAYVFNSMLDKLNERLKYYAEYLGFRVEFGINLESARKDIYSLVYQGQYMRYYEELSGGQQQLVDVCTAFALHDLVADDRGMKVLFMDEVFESLDRDNIELVGELIKLMATNKSVHLITHIEDFVVKNSNLVRVSIDANGQTQLSYN
jgi:DNA repair exonuclease SbcCD ATPase subunit